MREGVPKRHEPEPPGGRIRGRGENEEQGPPPPVAPPQPYARTTRSFMPMWRVGMRRVGIDVSI